MTFQPAQQPLWIDQLSDAANPKSRTRGLWYWIVQPWQRLVWLGTSLMRRPAFVRDLSRLSGLVAVMAMISLVYSTSTDFFALSISQVRLNEEITTSPDLFARFAERKLLAGDAVTTIEIPAIDVNYVVVQGVQPYDLRAGAGHYPNSPLPGEAGNVSIAGHRTTWGRPFNRLDELIDGDLITLRTPLAKHTYQVVQDETIKNATKVKNCAPGKACWITNPYAWAVVGPTSQATLTLTTCHPKGSARERLIIRARLVRSVDHNGKDLALPAPIPADKLPQFSPDMLEIPGES